MRNTMPRPSPLAAMKRGGPAFLGVDPGEHGACAAWCPRNGTVDVCTDRDDSAVAKWLHDWGPHAAAAALEVIVPRPATWRDKETGMRRQSVLRSTCVLYGSYRALRALVVAYGIRLLEVTPQEWQGRLPIPLRDAKGGETQDRWKRRLRDHARIQFPGQKITLDTSDALLLARYCRGECDWDGSRSE